MNWDMFCKSMHDVRRNPILALLIFLQSILVVAIGLLLLVLVVFILTSAHGRSFVLDESLSALAADPLSWVIGGLGFIISYVVLIFFTAWIDAGYLSMLYQVVKKGKTSLAQFNKGVKKHYKSYVTYLLLKNALWLLFFIPVIITGLLLTLNSLTISLLFMAFLAILFLATIYLSVGFLFAPPLLIKKNLSGLAAFKSGFKLLHDRPWFVIKTGLILLLASLAFSAVILVLQSPFAFFGVPGGSFAEFVFTVLQIVFSVVLSAFLFRIALRA